MRNMKVYGGRSGIRLSSVPHPYYYVTLYHYGDGFMGTKVFHWDEIKCNDTFTLLSSFSSQVMPPSNCSLQTAPLRQPIWGCPHRSLEKCRSIDLFQLLPSLFLLFPFSSSFSSPTSPLAHPTLRGSPQRAFQSLSIARGPALYFFWFGASFPRLLIFESLPVSGGSSSLDQILAAGLRVRLLSPSKGSS